MALSERLLRQWRKDSLRLREILQPVDKLRIDELHERILKLTQELLDQHLLRK